jgi:enoyl-CoA hydratase
MENGTCILNSYDKVALVTLSRPYCLDIAGKHELTEVIHSLNERGTLRTLLIAASDPQAWLVNVQELVDMSPDEARAFSRAGHRLADALGNLPVPVIAAVDSPALGGGCELVLACDMAIAGAGARFGQIEAMGGVLPAFGGTWRLARRIGHQRAMRMLFTGEVVDAETAKSIGLVIDVVPSEQLLDHAYTLAAEVTQASRQSIAAIKRAVGIGTHLPPSAISALEEEIFAGLFGTEDQRQRMRAFTSGLQISQQER